MDNLYNPYEDYDKIIHPDYRDTMNDPDNPIVYIDSMSDEEFASSNSFVICLILVILLLIAIITFYYLTN